MDSVSGQLGSVFPGMVEPENFLSPENLIENSSRLGGITIVTSPILVRNHVNSIRFTPETGYLQFNNINTSIEINSTWNFGYNAPIKFDTIRINEPDVLFTDYWDGGSSSQDYYISNPLNGYNYSRMDASGAIITVDTDMSSVILNGQNIGSFEINDLQVSKIQTEVLAVDGALNLAMNASVNIDKIKYTHDTESTIDPVNSITINGLMAAQKFQVSGSDDILPSYLATVSPGNEINSSLWTATGTMKLGTGDKTPVLSFQDDNTLIQGAPTASINPNTYSSIQIRGDSSPYVRHKYTIRTGNVSDMSTIYEIDPDGYIGDGSTTYPYMTNPRLDKSYLEAKIVFEGSIRARGLEGYVPLDTTTSTWGNANIGIVAADGVRSLTIVEAPGYGYGNDWHLPYDESKYQ
ncbi:MAG: hypothetical protein C4522_09340 [Desulfobacteraceae bacterium]|nr:MAG: hypothetical protein C4522_09340 [Desulfobacteraceae bacterium]